MEDILHAADGRPLARRWEGNPVLTADDVPGPATLVFNAGVARFRGRYVMLFRNDIGDPERKTLEKTVLGLAVSDDGLHWEVDPDPIEIIPPDGELLRCYDPRLTVLEDRCYVCFAADTRHGIRGGIAVTEDFRSYEVLSLSAPDNRNMVIFPERIDGRIARLERPFPIYGRGAPEAFDIWYSESLEGRFWGNTHLVLGSEQVPFANSKIGPAAPPVRTEHGWLATFHAVYKHDYDLPSWHSGWRKEYKVGIMLLDSDPRRTGSGVTRSFPAGCWSNRMAKSACTTARRIRWKRSPSAAWRNGSRLVLQSPFQVDAGRERLQFALHRPQYIRSLSTKDRRRARDIPVGIPSSLGRRATP